MTKLISKYGKALAARVTLTPSSPTPLHTHKKKSWLIDPTHKPRVGWQQTNNFLSPALSEAFDIAH